MNKKLAGIIVTVIVVAGAIFFATRSSRVSNVAPSPTPEPTPVPSLQPLPTPPPQPSPKTSTKPAPKKQLKPTAKSKPGTVATITNVVLSKDVTASGTALNPTSTFAPTSPAIYAVLSLKNAVQRTELSYTRHYEGKYVDSKVSHPTIDGVKYFHFKWELKPGQTRKKGNYSLTFYVNGKRAQTVKYVVQ